jgi:hypothetical protein
MNGLGIARFNRAVRQTKKSCDRCTKCCVFPSQCQRRYNGTKIIQASTSVARVLEADKRVY